MTIEAQAAGVAGGGITYGMVGGGRGAFIGAVHRKAIAMDGLARLAAGCFSTAHANTRETGAALGLPEDRLYKDYRQMIRAEAKRPDPIDFLVIVTPNVEEKLTKADLDFPGVADGIRGVRFIDRCLASSRAGATWVRF